LVDVPADSYEKTAAFWAGAMGVDAEDDDENPEYAFLGEVTPGFSMYVQEVGAAARVHLDIETDDVEAEVGRLERLGATRVEQIKSWWVMRDPAGLVFCVVRVQMPEAFEKYARTWS
jgi:predicted enzyme related to lactoylglutathione lyase